MAQNFRNYLTRNTGTSAVDALGGAANSFDTLISVRMANTTTSTIQVDAFIKRSSTDYYLIKNQELSNKDLYSIDKESAYYYSGGWHIKGVYSLILGFIFSASTIWNTNLMFLQSYAWIIGAFVAWITYYLLAKK